MKLLILLFLLLFPKNRFRTETYKKYSSYLGPSGEKCRSLAEVARRIVEKKGAKVEKDSGGKRKRTGFSKKVTVRKSVSNDTKKRLKKTIRRKATEETEKKTLKEELALKPTLEKQKEKRLLARQRLALYISKGMRVEEMYLNIGDQGPGEVFVCSEKVERKEIAAGRATTKNEI
jgi:hypothetical protein